MKRNRRYMSWREGWTKRKENYMLSDWTMKRLVWMLHISPVLGFSAADTW